MRQIVTNILALGKSSLNAAAGFLAIWCSGYYPWFRRSDECHIIVMCPECGALGPRADATDPPGHARHLRNQRFGAVNFLPYAGGGDNVVGYFANAKYIAS